MMNVQAMRLAKGQSVIFNQIRSICHKSKLPEKKVYHWPYDKYRYNHVTFLADPFTKKKFDENSKVIQIDGNIECGKQEFAKSLAEELNMKIIPVMDFESYYVNDHGYDYTALNPLLPERLRLCTKDMFHEEPSRHSVIHMLYYIMRLQFYQYLKGIQHIFNTGQGVIFVRSIFTSRALVEAMHDIGWLPMGYLRSDGFRFYDWKYYYLNLRSQILRTHLKPHLTIYLKTPVETCLKRIRASPNPMIANSKALIPEYLEAIERSFEDVVLPLQENSGRLLKVDYPQALSHDELMDVIDEIEEIDFKYDPHDTRFEEWGKEEESMTWHTDTRKSYTSGQTLKNFNHFASPTFDIAGLGDSITQVDLTLRQALHEGHVGTLGLFKRATQDLRLTSVTKVLNGYSTYDQELLDMTRADFL